MSAPGRRPPPKVGDIVNGFKYMGGDYRTQDPNVWVQQHGDDYLNSLPLDPDKMALVRSVANYEAPPGAGRGGLGSPEIQQILGFAKLYDPSFDTKSYPLRYNYMQDLNQKGGAQRIASLSNAAFHMRDLANIYDKMGNYNLPKPVNYVTRNLGAIAGGVFGKGRSYDLMGAADQGATALGPEAARVYKGDMPNKEEIEQQMENLGKYNALSYQHGNFGDMAEKFAQRLLTNAQSYQRAFGDIKPKVPLVHKDAAKALFEMLQYNTARQTPAEIEDMSRKILELGQWSPAEINGALTGARRFRETGSWDAVPAAPAGVTPEEWQHMSPEDRKLWHKP